MNRYFFGLKQRTANRAQAQRYWKVYEKTAKLKIAKNNLYKKKLNLLKIYCKIENKLEST